MKITFIFLVSLLSICDTYSQDLNVFERKEFIQKEDTLRYRILYPIGYKANKKYPLLVFLHGSGERGNDNNAQLTHGGRLFAKDSIRRIFRAIVIFPQCPSNSTWNPIGSVTDSVTKERVFNFPDGNSTTPARLVKQLIDEMATAGKIDAKRLYIGGLSLGGMGTFDMLARYPGFFAAAFPICGAGNTSNAIKFAGKTAVWIFHGDKDPAVNVTFSRDYYNELKKANATVKYTEYPGVGHDSWNNTFAEKGLVEWLLSYKKKGK
jgi:predicted peptidase